MSIVLSLVLSLSFSTFTVNAETVEQDGISVSYSTDKSQYTDSDKINTTLTVKNNNEGSVYNIELDEAVPEGFELADDSLKYSSIAELKSGEDRELKTVLVNGEGVSASNSADETIEQGNSKLAAVSSDGERSGGNNGFGISAIVFLCIMAVITAFVIILMIKNAKKKHLLSLLLVFSLLGTIIPKTGFNVKAVGTEINVSAIVNIDGEDVELTAAVRYSLSKPDKQYDDENVGEIYFEPISEEHIAISEDGTTMYADNELLVVAKAGISKTDIIDLAAEYDAEVVGYIEQTRDYQWRFNSIKTETELNSIVKDINKNKSIEDAYYNYISKYSETLNDIEYGVQWRNDLTNSADAEGKSWGVEAINAPAVWTYFNEHKAEIAPVKVGLVDSGFDETHEDLGFADNGVFYNNVGQNGIDRTMSDIISREHGTHVAGTMASNGTGDVGINGVYPYGDGNLYGVSTNGMSNYDENQNCWVSSMMQKVAYAELIVRNVKVINQSQGFNWQQFFSRDDNGNWENDGSVAKEIRNNYSSLDDLYTGFRDNDKYRSKKVC